jgi:hypothetical protein
LEAHEDLKETAEGELGVSPVKVEDEQLRQRLLNTGPHNTSFLRAMRIFALRNRLVERLEDFPHELEPGCGVFSEISLLLQGTQIVCSINHVSEVVEVVALDVFVEAAPALNIDL